MGVEIEEHKTDIQVDHSGSTVFLRSWRSPKADRSVLLLHDLVRNSAQYKGLAAEFVPRGFDLYACDLRGHGRSGKNLGHVPSFESLLNDLIQVLAWIRHEAPSHNPCIVIAEGYTCVIVFSLERRYQHLVHKAVFVQPRLSFRSGIGAFKKGLLVILSELMPRLLVPSRHFMRVDEMTRQTKLSVQFLTAFTQALERYPLKLLRWQVPSLVLRSKMKDESDFIKFKEYLERHKMNFDERFIEATGSITPLTDEKNLKVIFDWIA